MKVLVLGAGRMGYGVTFDLLRSPDIEVTLADVDARRLDLIRDKLDASGRLTTVCMDISNKAEVLRLMRERTVAVGCVSYEYNLMLTEVAIEAGVSFCDLGGNNTVVDAQFSLDEQAQAAGVTIIPDCGLAPGMVCVLVADATKAFDELDSIKIRVGGLPVNPKPPLDYQIVFSVEGLINEYVEPVRAIRNGQLVELEPMTELEELEFEAIGRLEAFNTSGGLSTLVKTFGSKVREMDYKTIRYPGHCQKFKLLIDLGLASAHVLDLGSVKVAPRKVLARCLLDRLPKDEPDIVLIRLTVMGNKDGQRRCLTYELVDRYDEQSGLSAMMRTTAFPASIIAQMMARGKVCKGVVPQELAIPSGEFVAELEKRGLVITKLWR